MSFCVFMNEKAAVLKTIGDSCISLNIAVAGCVSETIWHGRRADEVARGAKRNGTCRRRVHYRHRSFGISPYTTRRRNCQRWSCLLFQTTREYCVYSMHTNHGHVVKKNRKLLYVARKFQRYSNFKYNSITYQSLKIAEDYRIITMDSIVLNQAYSLILQFMKIFCASLINWNIKECVNTHLFTESRASQVHILDK